MSKELTEQLHNGTLKEGFYYAKLSNNRVEIITDCGLDILREIKGGDKIEVLDIVPDYYQFQNICKSLIEEYRGNYNLMEENEKLKELLLKAKGIIAAYRLTGSISFYSNEDEKCIIQIEKALGVR